MSLTKLVSLHLNYCFNKRNLLILILSFLLMQIMVLFFFLSYENVNLSDLDKMDLVWNNTISLQKIILGFIVIFIFGNFCLEENDEYQYLVISKTTKKKYYLTKFTSMIIIVVVFFFLNFFSFLTISLLFNSEFTFNIVYFLTYFYLLLVVITYAHLTMVLIRLFNSILIVIFILIIYISSSTWINVPFLTFLLPSIGLENITIYDILRTFIMLIL